MAIRAVGGSNCQFLRVSNRLGTMTMGVRSPWAPHQKTASAIRKQIGHKSIESFTDIHR